MFALRMPSRLTSVVYIMLLQITYQHEAFQMLHALEQKALEQKSASIGP